MLLLSVAVAAAGEFFRGVAATVSAPPGSADDSDGGSRSRQRLSSQTGKQERKFSGLVRLGEQCAYPCLVSDQPDGPADFRCDGSFEAALAKKAVDGLDLVPALEKRKKTLINAS